VAVATAAAALPDGGSAAGPLTTPAGAPAPGAGELPTPTWSVSLPKGHASLRKGQEIDLRDCTFGPGETHWGGASGQYLVDRNAFYAIVFLPTNLPGGHFRFRGLYPHARWFSYESYDEGLASEGVVDDTAIYPDPGSTSPFFPGSHYGRGHHSYKVDIYSTPPAQRASPPPHNVLYMGYRENPTYGGLEHSPYSPVLYRIYVPDRTPQGNVPLPHLSWVVDDPNTNPFQTDAEVCNAMEPARAPNQSILEINEVLDQRVSQPILQPAERNVDIPTDDAPTNPPYVNVLRPATNGYQGAYFNSKTPYVYIRPYAQYGRFVVVHFKAPTFARVEEGVPLNGDEQTRYWSWCAAQFVSPVNVTQACLMDKQFRIDQDGYATLVVSPPDARPTIGGRPYADWLRWPGGGADLNMRQIDPNPRTYPQSPYFIPPMSQYDALDYLRGITFEQQIKDWMGPYYPSVKYCSTAQFQHDGCGFPAALPQPAARVTPRATLPRRRHPRTRRSKTKSHTHHR
jgi:hypothetical protein